VKEYDPSAVSKGIYVGSLKWVRPTRFCLKPASATPRWVYDRRWTVIERLRSEAARTSDRSDRN